MSASNGNMVDITLSGSKDSPIYNPAFVIKNWGENEPEISLNGTVLPESKNLRFDFKHSLNGIDLIVWLRTESISKTTITITKKK